MKKKMEKLWDKALFFEGIRQTRWIAVLMFVLIALALSFCLIAKPYDMDIITKPCFKLILVFPMVMIYRLFSFQNRRSASDLYHSLPKNRLSFYGSYISAVLVWFLVAVPVYVILSDLVSQTTVNKAFHSQAYFIDTLYYLVAVLQIIAVTCFAMSITGNLASNIITALALIFVPGYLILGYVNKFFELCPFLTDSHIIHEITNPEFNILFSVLTDAKELGIVSTDIIRQEQLLTEKQVMLFGFVCSLSFAVLFLILGAVFTRKRKSEKAGYSSTNPLLQLLIRLTVTLSLCMSPVAMISGFLINQKQVSFFSIVIWYLVVLVVWFVIELITNGKNIKVRTCLVQLPVLVLINIIVIAVMVTGAVKSADNIPDEDDLRAVRILSDINTEADYVSESFASMVKITDEDTLRFLIDSLKSEMKEYKDDFQKYYNDAVGYTESLEIEFETSDGVFYRNLYKARGAEELLYKAVLKASENIYAYKMPVTKDYSNQKDVEYSYSKGSLRRSEVVLLYELLYDEIIEKKYPLSYFLEYDRDDVFTYIYKREADGDLYKLPVTVESPKTLKKFIELTNKGYDDAYLDTAKEDRVNKTRSISIEMYNVDENTIKTREYSWRSLEALKIDEEKIKRITGLLTEDENISFEENIVSIELWYSGVYIGRRWCNATDAELKELLKLIHDLEGAERL